MVVSDAFAELTEVFKCVEASDAEIKNVEIGEQLIDEGDEITASLTVGVPILGGVELHDGVSIQAENFDLEDQCVDIDLSVTLSVADSQTSYGSSLTGVGASSDVTRSDGVPAYKDPDALEAVYNEYDTFPEMTEALGADVTSETVRRYMVEYDIHDPNDSKPQIHNRTASDQTDRESSSADTAGKNASDRASTASWETDEGESTAAFGADQTAESTATGVSVTPTNEQSTTPETRESDATPDIGRDDAGESGLTDVPESANDPATAETDDTSVAQLLAESNSGDGDDSLVADGLGISKDLTVGELTTIVNESNTIREVKTELGVNHDHARRFLKETSMIDLVTQRLGAEQIEVSPREVRRRIDSSS